MKTIFKTVKLSSTCKKCKKKRLALRVDRMYDRTVCMTLNGVQDGNAKEDFD